MDWRKLQVFTALGVLLVGIRVAWVMRQRYLDSRPAAAPTEPALSADDSVFIRSSYVYDYYSAKTLVGKTLWIKVGYGYWSYPVRAGRAVKTGARLLPPLQPINVSGRLLQPWAGGHAIFLTYKDGATERAVLIGSSDAQGGNAHMLVDSEFFLDDPHKLFAFWGPKVWQEVNLHQLLPGMTIMQANLSGGTAQLEDDNGSSRTYYFPGDHQPLDVTFRKGKIVKVAPSSESGS